MVSLSICFLVIVKDDPVGACFVMPHRSRVGAIRCSLDREGEKASQVQGQPEKSSEQVRVGKDRAGDGHSKSISGAGNVGLGWAEMESWGVDREAEQQEVNM